MADDASVANRDSALQCIAKARAAAKQGALADAIRLVDKSLRLYATSEARTLRQALEMRAQRQQEAVSPKAASSDTQPKPAAAPASTTTHTHGPVKGAYSDSDEVEAIRVLKTSCYYTRLGLAKNASKIDIKRAFKRRAMQFHPDKNHAPAAADAFKAVNEAHQCLSNDESRRHYDLYGVEQSAAAARAQEQRGFAYEDAQELTPEDILNMFFNGGARMRSRRGGPQAHFRRHAPHMHQEAAGGSAAPFAYFFQFLPLLLLLLFSLMNAPSSDDVPFRLQRETGFTVARTTAANDVPFFVAADFARWYARDYRALARIEAMVEQRHAEKLKSECQEQRRLRNRAIHDAKKVRGEQQASVVTAAYEMGTPSCDQLHMLYSAAA